jgi:asparagine N-glycosylation enzyme membrane subunit Stt3
MNRKFDFSATVSVLGLIVVFGTAWGLDTLLAYLLKRNAETFGLFFAIQWANGFSVLFVAAFLLSLFWFVIMRAPRNIWVALIYLVTGLFIVVYPVLYYISAIHSWLPHIEALVSMCSSHLHYSGGFVAIMGLSALLFTKGKRADS